ncbi:MAG: TIGR02450 family Trp-rich protein [Woeseiaceae bacterium]
MNRVNSKKLLHSKWTAAAPRFRQKHFIVTKVLTDGAGFPQRCVLEAVRDRRSVEVAWQDLKDSETWLLGWQ